VFQNFFWGFGKDIRIPQGPVKQQIPYGTTHEKRGISLSGQPKKNSQDRIKKAFFPLKERGCGIFRHEMLSFPEGSFFEILYRKG